MALEILDRSGGVEGDHHKAWVIDEVLRALTGCLFERVNGRLVGVAGGESDEYRAWVKKRQADGYDWDVGTPP